MITHCNITHQLPPRVVVLGASGFVGCNLVDHLIEQRIETIQISVEDIDLCESKSVNLLQRELHKGDAVVFISALTPDKGKDIRTFMKNLSMGKHVSEALNGSGCSHVAYISSDAVYADDVNPVREDSYCSPSSYHGMMHFARELMLTDTLKKSKIPLLILRPSLLYGANDTHNGYGPNRFMRLAKEKKSIKLFGNGEEKRDHVYIKDLSRLINLGLVHKSEGILNVATGTSVSFFNVAKMVIAQYADVTEIEYLPRSNPTTHRHFDIIATLKAFPSFKYTPLQTGLSETIKLMADKPNQ